jgi:hypothetical protein
LLLAGLGVELAFAAFLKKPWVEWLSTLLSDAMITIGVWGEIHFGRVAREAGDSVQAQANARANEAALELARLKAPRVLTTLQAMSLSDKLRPFSGQSATVTASPRTFEAMSLADQIANMLGMAEIKPTRQDRWGTFDPGVSEGIAVAYLPGSQESESLGIALARLLSTEGFGAASYPAPQIGRAIAPNAVLVVVCEKT